MEARYTRQGTEEDRDLAISLGEHGLGLIHHRETSPRECAVCLRTGFQVMLRDISEAVQKELGIQANERAVFIEGGESRIYPLHDRFKLEDHSDLPPVPVAVFISSRVKLDVLLVPKRSIAPEEVLGGPAEEILAEVDETPLSLARYVSGMRVKTAIAA